MSIEKNVVVENEVIEAEIVNPNEIILSTGKKITKRALKGQHHIIEQRLLSICGMVNKEYGFTLGDLGLQSDVRTMVLVETVDGNKTKIPSSIAEVYEFLNQFEYDEWDELKFKLFKDNAEVKEQAKKLLNSIGSDNE